MQTVPTVHPIPAPAPAAARAGGTAARSRPLQALAAVAIAAVGFATTFVGLQWLGGHDGPAPRPIDHAPARPGWSLRATDSRTLDGQGFDVEHVLVGDDATELAFFSAHVEVAPTITVVHDTDLPDGGRGDAVQVDLPDRVAVTDVDRKDPLGMAKVGWEIDLAPLPNYPYQTIARGVAHFDDGVAVTAERGTSYRLVFPVPRGAGELDRLDLDFDWLDQGRTLTFVP